MLTDTRRSVARIVALRALKATQRSPLSTASVVRVFIASFSRVTTLAVAKPPLVSGDTTVMLRSKLLDLDARTWRLLTVAGSSYLGRLGGALALLLTIPVAKAGLSPSLFGVWMMLSGLLAFFSFADLGVGNSVLNRVTAAHAKHDVVELRRVVSAGYKCTAMLGAAVLTAWSCWVALSSTPTSLAGDVSAEYRLEVLAALHAFFVLLALNIPASLVQRVQLGMQAGHWVGLLQVGVAISTVAGVLTVRELGGGLLHYVLASLGIQVTANLISTFLWVRHLNRLHPRHAMSEEAPADWHTIKLLLRSGSLFLVLQLAVAFGFQSDSIVVVHQLGQAAYGDFAVVQRIYQTVSSIALAGLAGLWPAIGSALASGEVAWVRQTLVRSYTLVLVVSASVCLFIFLSMPWLLELWLGAHPSPPKALLVALGLWTIMEAMGNVSGAFLNAAQLIRPQVYVALVMGLGAFAGKWILVEPLGAVGVVLATLLAYSLTSLPMQVQLIRGYLRSLR